MVTALIHEHIALMDGALKHQHHVCRFISAVHSMLQALLFSSSRTAVHGEDATCHFPPDANFPDTNRKAPISSQCLTQVPCSSVDALRTCSWAVTEAFLRASKT